MAACENIITILVLISYTKSYNVIIISYTFMHTSYKLTNCKGFI